MNRNLGFVSIGFFAPVSQFIHGFWAEDKWLPKSRPYKKAGWIVGV
jgi:hypothetical protein